MYNVYNISSIYIHIFIQKKMVKNYNIKLPRLCKFNNVGKVLNNNDTTRASM